MTQGVLDELDRQAATLARIELLESMHGEAIDEIRTALTELAMRLRHDERMALSIDDLLLRLN